MIATLEDCKQTGQKYEVQKLLKVIMILDAYKNNNKDKGRKFIDVLEISIRQLQEVKEHDNDFNMLLAEYKRIKKWISSHKGAMNANKHTMESGGFQIEQAVVGYLACAQSIAAAYVVKYAMESISLIEIQEN